MLAGEVMHSLRWVCLEKNGGASHGVHFGNTSMSVAGLEPVRSLTLTLQSWPAFFRVVNFSLFRLRPFRQSFFVLLFVFFFPQDVSLEF